MYYVLVNKINKEFLGVIDYEPNVPQEVILYEISKEEYSNIQNNKSYFDVDLTEVKSIPQSILDSAQKKELINLFYGNIKALMSNTAKKYGYVSILDAVSFLNSDVPEWKNEAQMFVSWRDNTLNLLYKNLNDFNEGKISSLPTVEDFVKQPSYSEINIEKASRPSIL